MVHILTEPKNALVKQYQKMLSMDDVDLEFTPDALQAIAKEALRRNTGAADFARSSNGSCSMSCLTYRAETTLKNAS